MFLLSGDTVELGPRGLPNRAWHVLQAAAYGYVALNGRFPTWLRVVSAGTFLEAVAEALGYR